MVNTRDISETHRRDDNIILPKRMTKWNKTDETRKRIDKLKEHKVLTNLSISSNPMRIDWYFRLFDQIARILAPIHPYWPHVYITCFLFHSVPCSFLHNLLNTILSTMSFTRTFTFVCFRTVILFSTTWLT